MLVLNRDQPAEARQDTRFGYFDVYYGRTDALLTQRQERMLAAYEAHPERFPNGPPVVQPLPNAVYINPPPDDGEQSLAEAQ